MPQAQCFQIARQMQTKFTKRLAEEPAGIEERERDRLTIELTKYFARAFDTDVRRRDTSFL